MKIIIAISSLLVLTMALSCNEQADYPPGSYESQIMAYRAEKDSSFKFSDKSPLPDDMKKKFKGLKYYNPDTNYIFRSRFSFNTKLDTLKVYTTKKEDVRTMLRLGTFEFKVKGRTVKLTGFVNTPLEFPADVFIPFADKTNGVETYEVGRYLDLTIEDSTDQNVLLDFNLAYAPYCAYNPKYSCPLVPFENVIQPFIKAGEKIYKKK